MTKSGVGGQLKLKKKIPVINYLSPAEENKPLFTGSMENVFLYLPMPNIKFLFKSTEKSPGNEVDLF